MKDRIKGYQQGSFYRLLYNGNCLYSQWFIVAGSGLAVCAVPFIEGYHGDNDIEVDPLHAHICYLIFAHTCDITKEKYDEMLRAERIIIEIKLPSERTL